MIDWGIYVTGPRARSPRDREGREGQTSVTSINAIYDNGATGIGIDILGSVRADRFRLNSDKILKITSDLISDKS